MICLRSRAASARGGEPAFPLRWPSWSVTTSITPMLPEISARIRIGRKATPGHPPTAQDSLAPVHAYPVLPLSTPPQAIDAFLTDLDRYRNELDTLMTDHFEIFK